MALAGGEALALVADHAEGHVHQVLSPFVAHLFHHLEPLAEVQILLVGHDVEALVKVIFVLAPQGRGDVARGVESRAVLFENQAGRHAGFFLVQIHDGGSVADGKQVFGLELFDDAAHLVVEEGFAVVAVKGHAQEIVHPLRILERKLLEPVEQIQRFLVAVLDGLEPAAALVLQRGVMLGFLMEAHIQAGERFHAFTLHLLPVAPELVSADQLAELRAPVAQIVDGDRFVAQKVEDAA